MQASPDALDKLFACLVRAVRDQQPECLAAGMDVADILRFAPYKTVRVEIGADTDDDYGHTMTRLLAGERGLLFGDDLMQDDLRAELESKNPDVQAYRSYLNTRITLAQESVRGVLDALGPAAPRDPVPASAGAAAAPAAGAAAAPAAAAEPASPPVAARPSAGGRAPGARPPVVPDATRAVGGDGATRIARPGCRYCGQPLPQGRNIRFCPHCGQDLAARRCGACSAELEPGWKFCVACGRAATA